MNVYGRQRNECRTQQDGNAMQKDERKPEDIKQNKKTVGG
jgi:hypothetical protein